VIRAEKLTAAVCYHGESPFWDAETGRILFMDVFAGAILSIDPSGVLTRHQTPSPVATVMRRRKAGGFVVSTRTSLMAVDDKFQSFELIADIIDHPNVRTNDGGCDPLGGFIIGTMAYDGRPGAGAVYRVAPDHSVVTLLAPVTISNGVQWSVDGTQVYYIDTPTRRIDVFDVDPETGSWYNRRVHIKIPDADGYPDGMAIDTENGLWVALWGGGAINHYDATGRLIGKIRVPGVSQVSSCAFGGERRDVLFITTSRERLSQGSEPDAGALFALQTTSRGLRQDAFRG